MGNPYFSSVYKNRIINILLKNTKIIKLINPKESDYEDINIVDVLLGGKWIIDGTEYYEQGHIFDHDFVDDTTTDDKTFIFVETDISTVRDNIFVDFNLYICVFTSKYLVMLSDKSSPTKQEVADMGYEDACPNRVDILCDLIDESINGSEKIRGIGDVEPARNGYMTPYKPNNRFYGKCLKYRISNFNIGGDMCEN